MIYRPFSNILIHIIPISLWNSKSKIPFLLKSSQNLFFSSCSIMKFTSYKTGCKKSSFGNNGQFAHFKGTSLPFSFKIKIHKIMGANADFLGFSKQNIWKELNLRSRCPSLSGVNIANLSVTISQSFLWLHYFLCIPVVIQQEMLIRIVLCVIFYIYNINVYVIQMK